MLNSSRSRTARLLNCQIHRYDPFRQQALSKYAVEQRTGVSQQMVGYIERGLRSPSLEILLRMAGALGLVLGDVITRAAKQPTRRKPKKN